MDKIKCNENFTSQLLTISKTEKHIHNNMDFIIIEAEKQCHHIYILML